MSDESTPTRFQSLRQKRWVRWTIDLTIVVVVVLAISAWQARNLIDRSEPLPPATLVSLDGSTIDLEALNARRTVIYFWATWCGVCSMQSGAIASLSRRAADKDLDVISIVMHYQNEEQVRQYVDEHEIDYPVYLGTPSVAARYNISVFPTVYIVDDELRVRHGLVGYTTGFGLRARLLL